MTALQPPPLATWLLRQCVNGARYEPLIGDMLEEYRAGRSSFWYWRQVLVAILQSCFKDIRSHRLVALRAVVMTLLVYHLLWIFVVNDAMMQIQSLVFWLFAGQRGLPGWPPYFDGLTRVLLTLAGAFTGWSVAKLHRPYESTMVLLSAIALTLFELSLFTAISLHDQTFLSDVISIATLTMPGMVGVMVGGFVEIRSSLKRFLLIS
jgi:hypothetical protein